MPSGWSWFDIALLPLKGIKLAIDAVPTVIEDVWEFVIKDAVAELVTNPNSVIWADDDTVPAGTGPPPPPEPVSTVKTNVLLSPFVKVIVFKLTEAVNQIGNLTKVMEIIYKKILGIYFF